MGDWKGDAKVDSVDSARREVAAFMRRLYERGLTTTLGGNISLRSPSGGFLITPSGTDKAAISADDIGEVDADGRPLATGFKASIETGAHAAVLRARPDVNAVIHAHPVTVCAFAATSAEIETSLILETRELIGRVAYVPALPMGSAELADALARAVSSSDCVVMRGHGALVVGTTLVEAFERMEVLENAAKMTLIIRGGPLAPPVNGVSPG